MAGFALTYRFRNCRPARMAFTFIPLAGVRVLLSRAREDISTPPRRNTEKTIPKDRTPEPCSTSRCRAVVDGKASLLEPNAPLGDGPNSLFHEGGTSIVIHEKTDDYKTDPAGNSGARIACGVIVQWNM